MEYRGFEYSVLRTIPKGWRWIVMVDGEERTGNELDRDQAIKRAHTFIDGLLRRRGLTKEA